MFDVMEDMMYAIAERDIPMATMSDAHAEWHLNAGVPMGTPGCPQDACHVDDGDYWEGYTPAPEVRCGYCHERHGVALVKLHSQGF